MLDCGRQSTNGERWRDIARKAASSSSTNASTRPRPICQERNDKEEGELNVKVLRLVLFLNMKMDKNKMLKNQECLSSTHIPPGSKVIQLAKLSITSIAMPAQFITSSRYLLKTI